MDRRELLTLQTSSKHQDFSSVARTNSGLTPYAGPWTAAEVKHLLRRVMFGAPFADVDHFVNMNLASTLAELLAVPGAAPSPPLYTYTTSYADPNVAQGATWVTAPYDNQANGLRLKSFKGWWIGQMLNQSRSIVEKMTLFWSNHFSTETVSVGDARYSYATNALCRQYALGNFKMLTKLISLDPGMLKYLNGYANTKNAPDENYGRELQELFTIGKDANGNPYYSQTDVEMAAKVLTGFRIDSVNITYTFSSTKHDTTDKTFSAYYNNTMILGQSGAAGANELDDLLNMIFAKDEVALLICRKLYRYFVYYEIDAATETNVIQPLAAIFRSNNYDILPVLNALFGSEHFFDVLNRGCIIKAPVDHIIGMFRDYSVAFPDDSTAANLIAQYAHWYKVSQQLALIIQNPGDPPNVAGWPAYYQEPQFHELWINSDTLPNRNEYSDTMINTGVVTSGQRIRILPVEYCRYQLIGADDPDILVQEVIDYHFSEDVSATVKAYLKNILLSGQISNVYWSNAWNDYLNNPGDMTMYSIVNTRLKTMFQYIMDLSEYQLM